MLSSYQFSKRIQFVLSTFNTTILITEQLPELSRISVSKISLFSVTASIPELFIWCFHSRHFTVVEHNLTTDLRQLDTDETGTTTTTIETVLL